MAFLYIPAANKACNRGKADILCVRARNDFWLKKGTTFILPASCSCRRDASNELLLDFERSYSEFDLRSRSWPDRERSCYIIVDPYRRSEHIRGVFITLACFYQKLLPKDCWGSFMTWDDLVDVRKGPRCTFPIQYVNFTCTPMFESV